MEFREQLPTTGGGAQQHWTFPAMCPVCMRAVAGKGTAARVDSKALVMGWGKRKEFRTTYISCLVEKHFG